MVDHYRMAGKRLFNRTWESLEQKHRTQEENDEMIHAAHASTYHWTMVGTHLNISVGEWQISRVYAVLKRPEPALFHARRSLEIARKARLGSFYLAYGHETEARASSLAGKRKDREPHLGEARRIGAKVRDADDRRMLFEDLETI